MNLKLDSVLEEIQTNKLTGWRYWWNHVLLGRPEHLPLYYYKVRYIVMNEFAACVIGRSWQFPDGTLWMITEVHNDYSIVVKNITPILSDNVRKRHIEGAWLMFSALKEGYKRK